MAGNRNCRAVTTTAPKGPHRRLAHGLDVSHAHPRRAHSLRTGAQRHRLHPRRRRRHPRHARRPPRDLLMIGNVGTAVVMFPILRRYSETLSLSYVASRTIEATIIGVGAISLLSVVTLRDDLAASIGADGTSLDIAGRTLVAIHDWTFLLGPGFCVGVNGILLGWLMYRTLFSVPEGAFEAAFAIYLIVKGFRASPVLAGA